VFFFLYEKYNQNRTPAWRSNHARVGLFRAEASIARSTRHKRIDSLIALDSHSTGQKRAQAIVGQLSVHKIVRSSASQLQSAVFAKSELGNNWKKKWFHVFQFLFFDTRRDEKLAEWENKTIDTWTKILHISLIFNIVQN
jgi:hypothetical protein